MTADSPASQPPATAPAAAPAEVRIWDPVVRLGHWLLVVMFFVAYVTEDELLTVHVWAGYGVGAYVVLRLLWGVVGPRHARFSDFAYGPRAALRYLGRLLTFRAPRYLGHSPAGGLMVFVLLAALAATTVSGTALLAVEDNAGPLAPWLGRSAAVDATGAGGLRLVVSAARADEDEDERGHDRGGDDGGEWLEEVHEILANLTLALVVAHIAGVVLASIAHRENLVRAMITGRKRPPPRG